MVLVNVYAMGCMEEMGFGQCLFLPKLIYSGEKGRVLTFREALDMGLGHFFPRSPQQLELAERMGLEILENTAEEIAEVSMEMHHRLNSEVRVSKEDEELQTRFMDILRSYPEVFRFEEDNDRFVRMGANFLKAHADLLE